MKLNNEKYRQACEICSYFLETATNDHGFIFLDDINRQDWAEVFEKLIKYSDEHIDDFIWDIDNIIKEYCPECKDIFSMHSFISKIGFLYYFFLDLDNFNILEHCTVIPTSSFIYGDFGGELIIPQGIEEIGLSCFAGSTFNKILLPDSLKKIDGFAFSVCKELKELTLPHNLVYIGEKAFSMYLDKLNYDGTIEEFKTLVKNSDIEWWKALSIDNVNCKDGEVSVRIGLQLK